MNGLTLLAALALLAGISGLMAVGRWWPEPPEKKVRRPHSRQTVAEIRKEYVR